LRFKPRWVNVGLIDLSKKPEPNPVLRKQPRHCHRERCGTHLCARNDAKIITRDDNAERVACDFEGRAKSTTKIYIAWISNLIRY